MIPTGCVIDASVCLKVFIAEENSDRAITLFTAPPVIRHAPGLLFIECANVLWTKVRKGNYLADDAINDLHDLRAMDMVITSTVDLAPRALELACSLGITAYDACYVALAERLDVPLVTADNRLAANIKGSAWNILSLDDIDISL